MFGSKKSLPAQSSVLAPGPLLDAAREHYVIERDATAEMITRGLNDTYIVTGSDQQYALRVYRRGWRTQPEILWELSLLEHLKQAGAPVSAPVRTRSDNPFSIVMAPEGPRPVTLFEFAPGKECFADTMSAAHARAYGRGVAAIHLRMDSFEPAYPRFELDLDHLLFKPLLALTPRMAERTQDLTYLRRVSEEIRDAVVDLDDRGLSRGLCHGDTHGGNAHIDTRGEFTFFDFDCAGPGWRAYDVATFRWGMLHNLDRPKADENFAAFLEGYRELRGLPKVDEEAVSPFVAAREIWLLGLHASTAADHGYGFMHERYFDKTINFLHDWYKEMMAYT